MTSNASRPRLEVNVPIKASPLAKSSTSVAVSVPTRPGSPSPAPSRRSIKSYFEMLRFTPRFDHALGVFDSVLLPSFQRVPFAVDLGRTKDYSHFFGIFARFFHRAIVVGSQEHEIKNVIPVGVS